jgi:hypothetical protein
MSAEPVAANTAWGRASNGLRLGIAAEGPVAHLFLEDAGEGPLEVMSHVEAGGEVHLDWFTIVVGERAIGLADARDRSALVQVRLEPGGRLHHAVDVAAWAARRVNGGEPLASGEHPARATYELGPEGDRWSGRLEAGPVTLSIP